jgi:hypothetical protein
LKVKHNVDVKDLVCVSVMYGEINESLGEDPCDPAREKRILPPPFL